MKKKVFFICFIIVIFCALGFYSQEKFRTYNFIKAFYGINEISEDNLTYVLKDSVILVDFDFKDEYINYIVSLYENQGWSLTIDDNEIYSFCYEKECDYYEFYFNEFFSKKYALLVQNE